MVAPPERNFYCANSCKVRNSCKNLHTKKRMNTADFIW